MFHTDIKSSHGVVTDGDEALLYLVVRGKATEEKVPVLLDLMKEILTDCKLDNKRRAIEMLRYFLRILFDFLSKLLTFNLGKVKHAKSPQSLLQDIHLQQQEYLQDILSLVIYLNNFLVFLRSDKLLTYFSKPTRAGKR